MDETYKRFLAKGRIDLEALESRVNNIEYKLNSKGPLLLAGHAESKLKALYKACESLGIEGLNLSKAIKAENQPIKQLMDAITIN
ncbi:hypothetical protein N7530_010755 [Penicillium desertorum]|uniref:Uncharacterized protein n=1 Tax=Penicillium desertorum TaxID=1303715 RepID=A0A9X0BGZ8_9EURO|nr:hypothetical protein N7530_010755 [Penicillium desertorum]